MAAFRCGFVSSLGSLRPSRSSSYYVGYRSVPPRLVFFQGNVKTTQTPRLTDIELLFGRGTSCSAFPCPSHCAPNYNRISYNNA
ncbi:hypothetical protein HDV57DRAFT_487384 [Trichoderma longibrachiatum]